MYFFEWDERKSRINQEKHGISFEEARTVFFDEEALLITDPDHSEDEERFLILGFSFMGNVLVVVHCYRANDSIIRIISARRATKSEMKQYNERLER